MNHKASFAIIMALACVLLAAAFPAHALMPPQITSSDPPDGGVTSDGAVTLYGWSLRDYDSSEVTIMDVAAQQAVEFSTICFCHTQDVNGVQEDRCTIAFQLINAEPGKAYELRYMDAVVRFTYQP